MNLCLDIGNTRTKAAIFNGRDLRWNGITESDSDLQRLLDDYAINNIGVASVVNPDETPNCIREWDVLTVDHMTKLPIKLLYETPETLGADRICAAVGGFSIHPFSNVLTIDIGTCIKYEAVDKKRTTFGWQHSPWPSNAICCPVRANRSPSIH